MNQLATILLFLGTSLSLFGQQALSDNINGQWWIYSDGERKELDPSIHELGNFDERGLSYFMRHEKYGIINEKGEIVLAENYSSIKQLGGGYYLFLDAEKKQLLANWQDNQIQLREVNQARELQTNWYTAYFDTTKILINLPGQKEWILSRKDEIIESDFKHVYCEIDKKIRFLDPLGNDITLGEKSPSFAKDFLLIQVPERTRIIYRDHEIELPIDATSIQIREKEILYSQTGKSTILSAYDGKLIVELPYEDVSYYNDNLLTIRKNKLAGLARKTGEILIPAEYSSISVFSGLYYVRKASGAGVLDKDGRELVPCHYNFITTYRDFFKVHNALDFTGLISRKTGKTILQTDYTKLVFNDSVIRAFSGDLLRIIQLDSNHRTINDIVMSNVTSLVHTQASMDSDGSVDHRLFPLGWFVESVPKYDSLGFSDGEILRWGLKGANDSTLIPPMYREPKFVEQADFSLIVQSPKNVNLNGFKTMQFNQYQVISHRTGKRLIPENVFSIDTLDLLSRNYARFVSEKGRGVLLSDNSILRADYIDQEDTRYVRYCASKKTEMLTVTRNDIDGVPFFDFDMNNEPSKWIQIFVQGADRKLIRYNNAEWNFLDLNGKTVFSESFEFAEPYSHETAVVQKEGKWGVARADSFAIPTKYASIKRSPISDTLFVVKRNTNGTRFLDTNGRLMTNGMTRFYSNKENFAQIEIDGNKKLIAPDYSIISGESRFQKLFDNNIFFSKEHKEYTVYDHHGFQLGAVKLRPEEVWFQRYVMTKSRGRYGLLSMENDTLIPFEFKKIEQLGNYIFAQDGANNLLYDHDLNVIEKLKSKNVLVDSISGSYAVISEGNAIIYSSSNRKLVRYSGTDFQHFHNGYLVQFGKELIVRSVNDEFTFDFEPKELEVMGNNGYLVIDSEKSGHYFNSEWKEITFDQPLDRAKVVGEGLAISRSHKGTLLFGGDVAVKFPPGWQNNGDFRNGFLLMDDRHDEHQFVDVNGINQFKRTFDLAEPFVGKYATVKEKDGWTIIDGQGHFQILPSFGNIKPESQTIFSTAAQPLYGLFDSHGNELIPAEYQQLDFLRNDIIQARKNGEIFYFDRNGTPIFIH